MKNTSNNNKFPSEIKQRMVSAIINSNITLNRFYKITKISNGSLTKSGNITINTLLKFLDFFPQTDLNWLIKGEENNIQQSPSPIVLKDEHNKHNLKADALSILKGQLDEKDYQISELLKIINKLN